MHYLNRISKILFSVVVVVSSFLIQHVNAQISLSEIPSKLTFAVGPVPLHDPDIKERLEKELIINMYKHASTILILKESGRWKSYLQAMLDSATVPQEFFYLAVIESELILCLAQAQELHDFGTLRKVLQKNTVLKFRIMWMKEEMLKNLPGLHASF